MLMVVKGCQRGFLNVLPSPVDFSLHFVSVSQKGSSSVLSPPACGVDCCLLLLDAGECWVCFVLAQAIGRCCVFVSLEWGFLRNFALPP